MSGIWWISDSLIEWEWFRADFKTGDEGWNDHGRVNRPTLFQAPPGRRYEWSRAPRIGIPSSSFVTLVLNFSGARAGVDGIIGSRSHPEIPKAGWLEQQHNKPSFFLPVFSIFTACLICTRTMHAHMSLSPQSFCSASSAALCETIFQTGEGMKETTTKIKENKNKNLVKIKKTKQDEAAAG